MTVVGKSGILFSSTAFIPIFITPTPTPIQVGTFVIQSVSGVPSNAVALNPFQIILIYSGLPIVYMVLYNGTDEGNRQAFGGGQSPPLAAQNIAGGNYTVRLYDALTGGNVVWESSVIVMSSNQYRVGGTMSLNWPAAPANYKASCNLGESALSYGNYIVASGTMTDGGLWLSPSNTIPPDQPAGIDGGHKTGMLDFGGGGRPYQIYADNVNTILRGQMYLWAIVTSKADGTVSRLLAPYSPMTVN